MGIFLWIPFFVFRTCKSVFNNLTVSALVYIVDYAMARIGDVMNKSKRKICFAIFGVLLLMAGALFAEIAENKDFKETSGFAYGTVSQVSGDQIVVSEYDYEKDEETDNTYFLSDKIEIKNVASLKDIAVGDNVDIVYTTSDDKRIAQSISVEKPSSDEDPAGDDNGQGTPLTNEQVND